MHEVSRVDYLTYRRKNEGIYIFITLICAVLAQCEIFHAILTPHPQNQKAKKHTNFQTALSQTGGHSAILIKTAVTSIFTYFYFQLQNSI